MSFDTELDKLIRSTEGSGLEPLRDNLIDIFFGTDTTVEKQRWSVRYRQRGVLLAQFEMARKQLNGSFQIFYPNGKVLLCGTCRDDFLVEESISFFLPSGDPAIGSPAADNIISLRPSVKKKL